jgi:hypothetical protein
MSLKLHAGLFKIVLKIREGIATIGVKQHRKYGQ